MATKVELDNDTLEVPDDDNDLQDADALKDPPEYVAPSKDEWERTTSALKKANDQARRLRQEKRTAVVAPDADTDVAKAVADATTAADAKWKPRLVASAARTALITAGLTGAPDRLLKMFDHDEIDIDEDGTIDGIDEQVAALKVEFPEMFTKPVTKPPRIDGGRRAPAGDGKKKSSAELIQERYNAG